MASFDFDQAEGLRRMLAGPKPRIVSFLSATPDEDKSAMLVNLAASMAQAGSDLLLLDARSAPRSVGARLDTKRKATLLEVARQERALDEVIHSLPQGFGMARLSRRPEEHDIDASMTRRLKTAFAVLARQKGIILVDGELTGTNAFPLAAMANGDIVVQVGVTAASITAAYAIIKRLNSSVGRRPFGILVTGASDREAQVVFDNMAQAANRYLAVQLEFMGAVPADEHLTRAARLGRAVIEAFPLAGASVAFRRLAGRLALSAAGAHLGV